MNFYQNKTAFITGGSSGIGLAVAKALAKAGCSVVIFARSETKLQQAVTEIKSATAARVNIKYYSVDTTDNIAVKTCLDIAVKESGIPQLLVNSVGIAQPNYFENISFESFDKTIKTNLYSTWNVVHTLLPYMKIKGGQIVNTSSIAGFLGIFGYTDYCMSKFGIIGFSEALRSELKQYAIKVQVLCPPDTDTPGFEAENKNKPEETKAIGGNAKLLSPDAVAMALLKGMQKNTFLILPGFEGKLTRLLSRFFPNLIEWIMQINIKKAQKQLNNK
ncbi:MAG: SDR family oxidoreductase [Chitinophagales bacterium]|nr:SDR family oxidoreductase [Chitinophagales bacterium]